MPRYNTAFLYTRKMMEPIMNKILEYPLTIVEAPMGYGKTTAVKKYLADSNVEVLWQTITDGSVGGFWHGFSRLFKKIDSSCAAKLAKLEVPNQRILKDEGLEIIRNLSFSQKTVIVIDDYHLLASKSVDEFVELLIKNAHPNLHIVIISRVMFGENMIEMIGRDECYLINKQHFEFTKGEILDYYHLCGIELTQEEVSTLSTYTEGWVSALYLCMLSWLQEGRIECQASLYELIEKVVYNNCSAQVKDFLLHICIFDSFTLEQVTALWQQGNGESILKELIVKNKFITYDQVTQTYQMHNIFTSYLRDILAEQERESQQAIFLAAGEWCMTSKNYICAMDYFYKAMNFEGLLIAIELDKGNNTNNEHKEKIIKYFKECPMGIRKKYPIANLLYARKLFTFNEKDLFATQCKEIVGHIESIEEEETKKWLLGELELIYSFTKYNDIQGMSSHHKKAYELLQGPSTLFDNNASWTFGAPSILYMFYRKSGELAQEVQDMLEAMPHYYKIAGSRGFGAEYVMEAERFYYIGNFEKAEISIIQAMQMAKSHGQIAIIISAIFLQMRLALIKGDLSTVMNFIQQMRDDIQENGQYLYVHTADMCEAFIYLQLNQENKIPAWILAGNLQESCLLFPSASFFNMIYGKVLLGDRQFLKLMGIGDHFISTANAFPNLLGHVYTYIYMAAAQHELQHEKEAQLFLKQAIDIAIDDELIMPFVENGEWISHSLIELGKNEEYAEFIGKIQGVYAGVNPKIKSVSGNLESNNMIFRLSPRELEIAQLVTSGLSNVVIAEKLNLAEVTVKKTLQNIYAKLGIRNRIVLAKMMIERLG